MLVKMIIPAEKFATRVLKKHFIPFMIGMPLYFVRQSTCHGNGLLVPPLVLTPDIIYDLCAFVKTRIV